MAAKIQQLRDADMTTIYPVTKAEAVYMGNGIDTVGGMLDDITESNTTITIKGNTITKAMDNGQKIVIDVAANTIKETKTDNGNIIREKTTTFRSDGSIRIEVK